MRSHVNFTRVNKIETMYRRSRVNVKVEHRSTFTFTRGLSYIASFTRLNFRCLRTEKLRDSGNQLSGCVHTTRDSFWCSIYEQLAILFRNQRFSLRYKSRQNHLSYVWTEAISGMVIVLAQEFSGVC